MTMEIATRYRSLLMELLTYVVSTTMLRQSRHHLVQCSDTLGQSTGASDMSQWNCFTLFQMCGHWEFVSEHCHSRATTVRVRIRLRARIRVTG